MHVCILANVECAAFHYLFATVSCSLFSPYFGKKTINANPTGPYQLHLVTFHGDVNPLITSLWFVIVSSRNCDPMRK